MNLIVEEILTATQGQLLVGEGAQTVKSISTDTRTLKKGDLYVALKGPSFDGHDFISKAIAQGAAGAVISKDSNEKGIYFICVQDTLKALGDMAHAWRRKFEIPVVAITGSSGKTTTKDMLACCLGVKGKVCKTQGNFNNLVGLPLTIFNLNQTHTHAIWEMGMNAFGEIARLTQIAKPNMALITNVGLAHLEGVGDINGVAKAKAELFEQMGRQNHILVNRDDPYILKMPSLAHKLTFGFQPSADICCEKIKYFENAMEVTIKDPKQKTDFKLPLFGEYQARNWLACYAACYQLNISPDEAQKGINQFKLGKMRGEEILISNNILIINDAYNANPDSMKVALNTLSLNKRAGRRIAILGEMLELGIQSSTLHEEVGKIAAGCHVDLLITCGEHALFYESGFKKCQQKGHSHIFDNIDSLIKELGGFIKEGDTILVKGSRGAKMEKVVDFLKQTMVH